MPIGQISLSVTLRRPALTKFMAIPHYAYMVLKMPGPREVISIKGDVKRTYDCIKESCEMANRLTTSAELRELKESLVEPPPPPPGLGHAQLQGLQNVHPAGGRTQHADTIVYGRTFQGCSHRQHHGCQIGSHAHQIPPRK
jgi:hypothetical protein